MPVLQPHYYHVRDYQVPTPCRLYILRLVYPYHDHMANGKLRGPKIQGTAVHTWTHSDIGSAGKIKVLFFDNAVSGTLCVMSRLAASQYR